MILLIDNYDSFTYNIAQLIGSLNKEVKVVRNDEITIDEIKNLNPEAIIISPGPGFPSDTGICIELVKNIYESIPIFGICLGHQIIAEALGGNIIRSNQIKHGKQSSITHTGTGPFSYLTQPLDVMCYHSFVLDQTTLPNEFNILATSLHDKEIMAIQYRDLPIYGVQFHPESIGTSNGQSILKNFFEKIEHKKGETT